MIKTELNKIKNNGIGVSYTFLNTFPKPTDSIKKIFLRPTYWVRHWVRHNHAKLDCANFVDAVINPILIFNKH